MSENVDAAFNKRETKGGWPSFFPFENEGDAIVGQVTGKHERAYEEGKDVQELWHVTNLNGEEFTLPGNVLIVGWFESEKVQFGDFVRIKFDGEGKTKKGFRCKNYSMSKMTEEEFKQEAPDAYKQYKAATKGKKIEKPAKEPSKLDEVIDPVKSIIMDYENLKTNTSMSELEIYQKLKNNHNKSMTELKEILKPAAKAEEAAPATIAGLDIVKLKSTVSDVLEFFEEGKPVTEMLAIVKDAGFDINEAQLKEHCGDMIKIDENKLVTKA